MLAVDLMCDNAKRGLVLTASHLISSGVVQIACHKGLKDFTFIQNRPAFDQIITIVRLYRSLKND